MAGLLRSGPGQGSSLPGRALVAKKVKQLVIEDGLFPTGGPPFTNEKIDIPATKVVVGPGGWPTSIAWVDGLTGINTKVGATLCSSVPPKNPMRIVYQKLFSCGPPGDGDWDGPTMLYAVDGSSGVFSELGQGGAAVINAQSGLSWGSGLGHPPEVYVHVVDASGQSSLSEHETRQPPTGHEHLFENTCHVISGYQTDIPISCNVPIRPKTESRTPMPGLHIFYDDA